MTDPEIASAIVQAMEQPGSGGLADLVALRDRLQADRGTLDAALGLVWDALVRVAGRRHADLELRTELAQDRARWLTAVRGPCDPETIRAWVEIGFAAEDEYDWPLATRAWEAVAAAPLDIDALPADVLPLVSQALRGHAGSRKTDGRIDEARRLFERDLALNERMYPRGHAQLALSLENLAGLLASLGESAQAAVLRQRQRDVLVAIGASAGQVQAVDAELAKLRQP
jgi:hypothetical protein